MDKQADRQIDRYTERDQTERQKEIRQTDKKQK